MCLYGTRTQQTTLNTNQYIQFGMHQLSPDCNSQHTPLLLKCLPYKFVANSTQWFLTTKIEPSKAFYSKWSWVQITAHMIIHVGCDSHECSYTEREMWHIFQGTVIMDWEKIASHCNLCLAPFAHNNCHDALNNEFYELYASYLALTVPLSLIQRDERFAIIWWL